MSKGIDLSIFAAAAAQYGVDFDMTEAATFAKEVAASAEVKSTARAERLSEGDAVLRALHNPHSTMYKKCNYCGKPFSTNYCGVGCCSVICRKRHLEEIYKVPWNPEGGKIWGDYEPPLVVSAESLEKLYAWAKGLVADYERLRDLVDQPADNPQRVREQYFGVDKEGFSTSIPTEDHQSPKRMPTVLPGSEDDEVEQYLQDLLLPSEVEQNPEESETTLGEESVDDILANLLD